MNHGNLKDAEPMATGSGSNSARVTVPAIPVSQTRLIPRWLRHQPGQRRLLVALFIALLLALSYAQWPRIAETVVYDLSTRLIPAEADLGSVAFVDTGSASPDFQRLAGALDLLREQGVRKVGIFLPLDRSQSPPDMRELHQDARRGVPGAPSTSWVARLDRDAVLAQAISRHGSVVIPAFFRERASADTRHLSTIESGPMAWYAYPSTLPLSRAPGHRAGYTPLQAPLPVLAESAAGVGAVLPEAPPRGISMALNETGGPWAGFLLPLLNPAGNTLSGVSLEPGRGVRVGGDLIPLGPSLSAHPLPLRQDPRGNGLLTVGLDALLGGEQSFPLQNRTVILGQGDAGAPLVNAGGGLNLPAAVWHTYALGSLLDQRWVAVPGWYYAVERLLLVLVGLYLLTLPLHLAGRTAGLLLSALLVVVVFNAGLLMLLVKQLWLPVTLPVMALLIGHGLLWAWLRHAEMLARDRGDASEAHHQLGSLLRAQGQLEPAFEHLRRVREVTDPLCQQLYQLGQDMVRRRQYARAMDVYLHLDTISPRYRDVPVRIERLRGLASPGRKGLGHDMSKADSGLIVDGDSLEKPTLGRYQIECQLGKGSMGIVYLGVDPKISRKVAIKTLALNQEFEPEMLEQVKWRFFREAEASGRLNHRNIVTIYDVGEEHDLAFIAMDYLEGSSLETFTRRETLLPVDEVLELCAQVAEGLGYAHGQGVIHRDVKPANVIYDRSKHSVTITDFGIACLTDNNRTRTGTILGTPAFMSPEQVSGKPVDGRSDLFSLGVTLYQLLCGQLPFTADTMAGLVYQITQTRHQSISEIRPELGPLVALILNRALEKDPDRRYQTGTDFAKALRECAGALKRSPRPGQFTANQAASS